VQPRRVVIVGGGITGLTTAYRLLKAGRDAAGAPFAVTLLEARPRLGGNIRTERREGFLIDGGPDSFVVTRPQAAALCKEIGLGDRLIPTTPKNRKVYVLHRGVLERLPEGLMLGVPTRILPMVQTKLFSWPAKARMGLDLVIPRRAQGGDESVGHFIRRRLGGAAVTQLAEPLLGGIYAGNVDTLSMRSTFPQLLELEQQHGSLIRGAIAQMAARASAREEAPASPFQSLLGGMGELIDALAAKIEKAGGEIRIGAEVTAITKGAAGAGFLLRTKREAGDAAAEIAADDVVLCTPAYVTADALDGLDRDISATLRQVPYLSTATVVCGYHRADVQHPLDASGLIVPKAEGRRILAATFISSKWSARSPSDATLLRVFVGGHRDAGALAQSDDELIALAQRELAALIGVRARPILARVYRFARANAQPVIGHAARVQKIRALAARHPGLHFAGAAFDGVGIPDCVRQGGEVAARIAGPR
jgi:protoporphyrinogen/coproporphyrinogen III oxidase